MVRKLTMAMEINTVQNKDCMEGMAAMDGGSVDIVAVSKSKDKDGNTINCELEQDDFRRKSFGQTYHETTAIINKLREYKKDDG